ncbi:HAD-IIIC family phosphatase [Methylomagnum sp.]
MKKDYSGHADNNHFENHRNHLYLTPLELRRTETPLRRVLIVGSCFADSWLFHHHNAHGIPVDYVVHNAAAQLPDRPPHAQVEEYDFMIVQLGLRFILHDVDLPRIDPGDENALEAFFNEAYDRLRTNLGKAMEWSSKFELPTFVANFFVPQANALGRLMPRYSLSNPVHFVERLNRALYDLITQYDSVHLLDIDQVASVFGKRLIQEDALLWNSFGGLWPGYMADTSRLDPVPPLHEHYAIDPNLFRHALWDTVVSMYRTMRQIDAVKLVAVNLDNTLWMGVAAEESVGPHLLENWFLGIIEALLYLKQRGILLAIISRNDEAYIRSIWDKIMTGRLHLNDFAAVRINRQSKPDNMREILDQLNLPPGQAVFIDDSPAERVAMRAAFPDIRVLGRDSYYLRRILLWSAETQAAAI